MTVNEIEARTGLDRGTVRYYESEGLIKPVREPNGYRNYSEADLEKLQKVKLLRTLGFSVDDIRAMDAAGGGDFQDRLRARSKSLDARAGALEDAKRVIENMLADRAEYGSLRSDAYLTQLESGGTALPEAAPPEPEPEGEPEPRPDYAGPWARYFARMIDWSILELLYALVSGGLLDRPPIPSGWGAVLNTVLLLAATLLLEPVFLWTLGATPGKLLLGLRVRGRGGENLPLGDACARTWGVLFWGEGLRIPLVALWRNIKSFRDAKRDYELPWESGSDVISLGGQKRRIAVTAAWLAVNLALMAALNLHYYMPLHRGELTPAELAENVNRYMEHNLDYDRWRLNADGTWTDTFVPSPGTVYLDRVGEKFEPAPVELTVENGVVTGLVWRQSTMMSATDVTYTHGLFVRALSAGLAGASKKENIFALSGLENRTNFAGISGGEMDYGPWRVVWTVDDQSLGTNRGDRYDVELTITGTDR